MRNCDKVIAANKPMLATPIKSKELNLWLIDTVEQWICEEKFDGERLLITHTTNRDIQQRQSRFLKSINLFQHRVLLKPNFHNCVFDGELIFCDNKTHKFVSICNTGCRVKDAYAKYIIFDIQFCNGNNVQHKNLLYRKKLLERIVQPTQFVNIANWYEFKTEKEIWKKFNEICSRGGEGLMLKRKNQEYLPNKRKWLKLKPLHLRDMREEYELFVNRAIKDKNGIFNILECGYYKSNEFIKICSVTSGINGFIRGQIVQLIDNEGYFREHQIVTIMADSVTIYRHLRHPIFKCFRFDLNGAETKDIIDKKLLAENF